MYSRSLKVQCLGCTVEFHKGSFEGGFYKASFMGSTMFKKGSGFRVKGFGFVPLQ